MTTPAPNLTDRRVLVPGGTGGVGEGIVRSYLDAGAHVVVPTRSQQRAEEFQDLLGPAATNHLHLVVHDYTTFAGAEDLANQMVRNLGGIDAVVAPIGGWWAGRQLWEIDEADWQNAFVGLATTHLAVARACLPEMSAEAAYLIVLGDSGTWPVPGSGLVSMEQAAVAMMLRVLEVELQGRTRVFSLVLGPVDTRTTGAGSVSAGQVGAVAVAASAATATPGRAVPLHDQTEVDDALAQFAA